MIKQLCAKHQLNGDVVAKASEFERLLTMKNIRLTEGEVGKHAIFVALAIEVLPQQQQQLSSSSSSSTNNSSSNASIADSLFNSSGLTRDIYSHTYAKNQGGVEHSARLLDRALVSERRAAVVDRHRQQDIRIVQIEKASETLRHTKALCEFRRSSLFRFAVCWYFARSNLNANALARWSSCFDCNCSKETKHCSYVSPIS
jgi:hypothetical protein